MLLEDLAVSVTIVVVLGCAACEGGPPARAAGEETAGAGNAAPSRGGVPIAFEARKPGSRAFPFPFVEGKIGGQPTRFVLDTGASVHAIDASIAAAAQLGSPAKASSLSIDGWGTLPEHAVVVRELPATLRAHGIGGVIAPQLLVDSSGQAVVVDLLDRQLRMLPQSTAATAMTDLGPSLSGAGRKLCPAESDGLAGLGLAVDATVDGEPARLAVDTGAARTLIVEGTKAAARAVGHPVLGRTVSAGVAADVATSIYGGVPFKVGAWASTVDVGVSEPHRQTPCGADGRLGIDVLQQCGIAIAGDEMWVSCRALTAGP